jgi:Mor family transcriptional regulator
LTDALVKEIRLRHTEGVSLPKLKETYGVSVNAIWMIIRRKSWQHVE